MDLIDKQLEEVYNNMAPENAPKKVSYEYIEKLMQCYDHCSITDVKKIHI